MNYYRRYIGDYQRDTGHLSVTEHGAYTLLLDAYYATGSVPVDHDHLCRLCRAMEEYERKAVIRVADSYFPVNGDGSRHNHRADMELEIASKAIDKMRESGRKGAENRWSKDRVPHRVGDRVTDGVTIQPPTTIHQPPSTNPPGVTSPADSKPITPLSGKPDVTPKNSKSAYIDDARNALDYLNNATGKGFELRNRSGELTASADKIIQRLKQGYTVTELREVVYLKVQQWADDENMCEYLRPSTLFSKEKFEQYLGELKGVKNG